MSAPGPVWLVGLDGASFEILEPMLAAGNLPVLAGLIAGGAGGVLKSTVAPFTPQAWASVITGNNPGKHGVFGFVRQTPNRPPEFLSSKSLAGEKLWARFSRQGLDNLVVNIPLTYPPDALRGIMVTGMMTPSIDSAFTYPIEVKKTLLQKWPDYKLDVSASLDRSRDLNLLEELGSAMKAQTALTLDLLAQVRPDFFFYAFILPDRIQHTYGHYIHPKSTAYNSVRAEKWRERIWEAYAEMDAQIGRLIDAAPPDANIVFASDHGFTVERGSFYTNDFLASLDLLKVKRDVNAQAARTLIRKLNVSAVKKLVPNQLIKKTINYTKAAIDWERTMAYSSPVAQQGIYINLKGREPGGIVDQKDFNSICDRIIEALNTLGDSKTGKAVVKAHRREEIFDGPFLDNIPDIVFDFEGSSLEAKDVLLGGDFLQWSDGGSRGIHHRDGLFIAVGPNVRPGWFEGLVLEDLAPNLLAMAGLDGFNTMDGRLREDIFKKA